jgi:hypothetical protein
LPGFGAELAILEILRSILENCGVSAAFRFQLAEEREMAQAKLTIPEIAFIAITRIALGAGIGLLCSARLTRDQRKAAGWALALVGGITTIPFALRMKALLTDQEREMRPAA